MLGRVDPAGLAANFCPSVVSLSLLGEYRAWLALNEGLARGILAFTNHDLLFLGSGKLLAAVCGPRTDHLCAGNEQLCSRALPGHPSWQDSEHSGLIVFAG